MRSCVYPNTSQEAEGCVSAKHLWNSEEENGAILESVVSESTIGIMGCDGFWVNKSLYVCKKYNFLKGIPFKKDTFLQSLRYE